MSKKTKNVLSLFSSCGGLDLGFHGGFEVLRASINEKLHPNWISKATRPGWVKLKKNSFRIVFANDIKREAYFLWTAYFKKFGIKPEVYHLCSIVDLVKAAKNGQNIFPKNVDIVTGGFPCQDFSVAGKRKGFNSHRSHTGNFLTSYENPTVENRGVLYIWMREVIEILRPKMFVAENVKGLVSFSNVKQIIENDFRSIGNEGYLVVNARVLHAGEYGVPQTRERVFFLGFNKKYLKKEAIKEYSKNEICDELDPYPVPTHTINKPREQRSFFSLQEPVTVRMALKNLPEPEWSNDPSQMWYSKAKYYGKHMQGQIEVNLDELGPTIRSEHHGNIEFRRLSKEHGGKMRDGNLPERRLTVRECARLQTFPDDYAFVTKQMGAAYSEDSVNSSEAYKLVGDAVPPLLSYHLAKRIEELWEKIFKEGPNDCID
jgi:DNA (cytosine-5)-methyltransferase 1